MSRLIRCNLLLCTAYAAAGWLALQVAVMPGYATPLFPPAGIALAAMLIWGPACLPGVFAGSTLVQLSAASLSGIGEHAWITLLMPPIGATTQAWFGYWLTREKLGLPLSLDTQGSIIRFVAVIAPLSCLISASIAVPALMATGSFLATDLLFTWADWWAGDTLGVLIVVPMIMAFAGEPASDWRSRRWSVALPLGLALLALALTFLLIRDWEKLRLQRQFDREAEHAASLVGKRLDALLDQMQALERLAAVQPQMTREQWRNFVTPMLERYPGTQNFGWSPLVRDRERPTFETRIRAGGNPDFRILGHTAEGQSFVVGHRPEYLPIVFVEPFERNRSMLGLDPLVVEPTADAAWRSGTDRTPVATASLRLAQERGDQRSIVVHQAVFDSKSLQQIGLISGVFRMDDMISAALTGHQWEEIDLCLIEQPAGRDRQRLFGPAGCESDGWLNRQMHFERRIHFAEQDWTLRAGATRVYLNAHRSSFLWMTLAFGLVATGFFGAFLLLISGRARRVEQLVDDRTHQLAAASHDLLRQQEEFRQAQRIARLGSWETQPGTEALRCSAELLSLFDLPPDAAPSLQELIERLHPDDRPALSQALKQAAGEPCLKSLDCRMPCHGDEQILHVRIESDIVASGLRIRGTAQDVTLARAADEHIAYLAHFDVLTGLPNRTQFNERAQTELSAATRYQDNLALLFLDLDQFKTVNDTLGHHAGDQLLQATAERLATTLRKHDFIARLGGDEFVVLLPRLQHQEDAAQVARKLIETLRPPVVIDDEELNISVSIGIALFPEDGKDVGTLLKRADMAMYSAKDNGRNNFHFFESAMDARARERLSLENALRRAIERDELVLHYQPQVAINGYPLGCEALVRWQHPELGLLPPQQFIGIAEECGLILPLGEWVLRTACRQQLAWAQAGNPLVVAVNISALQFRQHDFAETVRRILDETGADPNCIELELTESALMLPTPDLLERMNRLRAWGLRLALDDFGTGYSSLSYLKRLPIHRLKLDRSFVMDLPDDPEDAAIASATLSLAHNLGMEVVAEGVEDESQREFLSERGCSVLQGFLFSRPLNVADFARWQSGRDAFTTSNAENSDLIDPQRCCA